MAGTLAKYVGALSTLFATGALAQQGPYFVLGSGMPLVIERADPVFEPGQIPSNHVHSVVGGNGFAATMDFAQTQTSTCATVPVIADKSNYWMPALYFQDPNNGTFIRVPEQPYHKIYYKYGNGENQYDTDITEFPQEFRMVGGSVTARSYNSTSMGPYGSEIGWACHGDGTSAHPDFYTTGLPEGFTACPGGLAAALTLPSCWNGQDFDPSNPSAHMAYPVADTLQGCPATHRVARFPQIFVEYWLNVDTFNGLYTAQDSPFILADGDPTGYSFHVVFINGWQTGVLNAIMPTCMPGNTGTPPLSDSTCFGNHGGLFTSAQMEACRNTPLSSENVGWNGKDDNPIGGVLTYGGVVGQKLPGCNPIQAGPGPATIYGDNC
ncbi:hypothetical protein F5Y16DRAFT_167030 [Xylariaceae sp. FL0255]|nr:hypothetical protein F5Y16DRAFT_167030 [Xylariaceae sp. FL0255]